MKFKKEKCKYCGSELESKTTRKVFCSSKCRVYWNRDQKGVAIALVPATKGKKAVPAKTVEKGIAPPPTLKGIDLAIWKAEQNK